MTRRLRMTSLEGIFLSSAEMLFQCSTIEIYTKQQIRIARSQFSGLAALESVVWRRPGAREKEHVIHIKNIRKMGHSLARKHS